MKPYKNFNSTMVRLEAELAEKYKKLFTGFQFHYGAIGSWKEMDTKS